MSHLITQAQLSADQADWSTVVLTLQRLCLTDSTIPLDSTQLAQVLPLAINVLAVGDFQEQWEVAKVFATLGQAAIAPLTELLQDDTAELEARWFAARILGDLNDPTAMRALVEQLQNSEDEDLSQVVAEALAHLGPAAIAALTELLASATTRLFAAQALAQIRHSDCVIPLLSIAGDPDPTIRAIALEALSSFPDDRIPPVLMAATQDPAVGVRKVAIAGLSGRTALLNPDNLMAALTRCLWDLNLGVCQQAALALGKLQRDEAVPLLQRALLAPNTPLPLQLDLVRALSWIGTEQALISLAASLPPQTSGLPLAVCQEILTLLGRWEAPDLKAIAAQTLITVLPQIEASTLRRAIALALGELKQPIGLEPLIHLLADHDAGVRLHAISALKQLDSAAAYTRLTELQTDPALSENFQVGVRVALQEWETELPL
ncbi:MAG: HEAT repeat domain-containing protein [Leptolyngbyaceae cyanobacterium bins.349]|nr:HEAT repeat domain-containing protein [Leptolyngbyaceae cyanobacterium bins.349]